MDKRELIKAFQAELRREIDVVARAAFSAREAATHEENKPENDKDTRAIEAAYLAGAQADRVRDLEQSVNAFEYLPLRPFAAGDVITSGAMVEVDRGDKRARYFVAPQGGGLRATLDGVVVQVITPQSPVGKALLGKVTGDVVEIRMEGSVREYEILRVE